MTVVCWKIPFGKTSYRIQTIQFICNVNQLSDFYMTIVFTISFCQINYNNYTDSVVMSVKLYIFLFLNSASFLKIQVLNAFMFIVAK